MKKIIQLLAVLALSAMLGTQLQANEKSLLPDGKVNGCLQIAEYGTDGWVKMSQRQMESSPILKLSKIDRLGAVFSGLKMSYSRTEKITSDEGKELQYDIYTGHLNDGRKVDFYFGINNPEIDYVQIGSLNFKMLTCIPLKD